MFKMKFTVFIANILILMELTSAAPASDSEIPASPPLYPALLPCALPPSDVTTTLLTQILQSVNSINNKIPTPSPLTGNDDIGQNTKDVGKSVKLEDVGGGQFIHVAVVDNIDWFQAMTNCKALGLKLVSLETKEKNERIQSYLSAQGLHRYYWTSGIRLDNTWLWSVKNEKFSYTGWAKSQPENGVEFCMLVRYYYWADTSCNKPHSGYICEP